MGRRLGIADDILGGDRAVLDEVLLIGGIDVPQPGNEGVLAGAKAAIMVAARDRLPSRHRSSGFVPRRRHPARAERGCGKRHGDRPEQQAIAAAAIRKLAPRRLAIMADLAPDAAIGGACRIGNPGPAGFGNIADPFRQLACRIGDSRGEVAGSFLLWPPSRAAVNRSRGLRLRPQVLRPFRPRTRSARNGLAVNPKTRTRAFS